MILSSPCEGSGAYYAVNLIFDFGTIYIVCWFISYASPLILYLHFFLTYLLPYLSFPVSIDPLHFQAGCRIRRLNLALVFVFMLGCSTFLLTGECLLLLC